MESFYLELRILSMLSGSVTVDIVNAFRVY